MGKEINLLKNYPKSKRDLNKRLENKTKENIELGKEANEYSGASIRPIRLSREYLQFLISKNQFSFLLNIS